jgi:hypothetical protein
MAKYESEIVSRTTNIAEHWVTEDEDATTRRLVFVVNKSNYNIKFYPKAGDFIVDEITIEGYRKIPDDFSTNGYVKHGILQYLNRALSNYNIESVKIDRDGISSFRKVRGVDAYNIVFKYDDFKTIRDQFNIIRARATKSKKDTIEGLLHRLFPSKFEESTGSVTQQYRNVIQNLNADIIEHLSPADLTKLEGFIVELLDKKYTSNSHKFMQLARTKINIDTVAIDRILKEFKGNITNKVSENDWGKWLQKNLFLLDSKYVKILPEINVMLGATNRNADFGMIDTKGYLDIFEIKKADTPLMSAETDRGNHYWHSSTVKAITQAEKYLYNAERKATNLAADLTREAKVKVEIVRPRAVLVTGHSDLLDTEAKKEDFRVLRKSLKNVEVVLYDELLEGLENQKNKYYDQIVNPSSSTTTS